MNYQSKNIWVAVSHYDSSPCAFKYANPSPLEVHKPPTKIALPLRVEFQVGLRSRNPYLSRSGVVKERR